MYDCCYLIIQVIKLKQKHIHKTNQISNKNFCKLLKYQISTDKDKKRSPKAQKSKRESTVKDDVLSPIVAKKSKKLSSKQTEKIDKLNIVTNSSIIKTSDLGSNENITDDIELNTETSTIKVIKYIKHIILIVFFYVNFFFVK